MTDITERKRAEEEREALSRDLQESKAWLEEAQRVATLGYWVWDLQTNQLIWSDETYRIFGLSPQEGLIDLGKVREMIHPNDRETVFRMAEEAVRSGARADCEHRLFRPNREMRVVHSLADLKRDASARPHQMFGTTRYYGTGQPPLFTWSSSQFPVKPVILPRSIDRKAPNNIYWAIRTAVAVLAGSDHARCHRRTVRSIPGSTTAQV